MLSRPTTRRGGDMRSTSFATGLAAARLFFRLHPGAIPDSMLNAVSWAAAVGVALLRWRARLAWRLKHDSETR